jgi:hypothetical protein
MYWVRDLSNILVSCRIEGGGLPAKDAAKRCSPSRINENEHLDAEGRKQRLLYCPARTEGKFTRALQIGKSSTDLRDLGW